MRIAFVSSSLPRRCGIATFTSDLIAATRAADPDLIAWVAVHEPPIVIPHGMPAIEPHGRIRIKAKLGLGMQATEDRSGADLAAERAREP